MSPRIRGSAAVAHKATPRSAGTQATARLVDAINQLRHAVGIAEKLARADEPAGREALLLALRETAARLRHS